jgi:hypothetical protein
MRLWRGWRAKSSDAAFSGPGKWVAGCFEISRNQALSLMIYKSLWVTFVLLASAVVPCLLHAATPERTGAFLVNIESQNIHSKHSDSHVQYDFSSRERYYVYVPAAYTGSESYGLIVFTDAKSGTVHLPMIWKTVLDTHKYIFIAAQNAGNDQPRARRLGLAVVGALKIMSGTRSIPTVCTPPDFPEERGCQACSDFINPTSSVEPFRSALPIFTSECRSWQRHHTWIRRECHTEDLMQPSRRSLTREQYASFSSLAPATFAGVTSSMFFTEDSSKPGSTPNSLMCREWITPFAIAMFSPWRSTS